MNTQQPTSNLGHPRMAFGCRMFPVFDSGVQNAQGPFQGILTTCPSISLPFGNSRAESRRDSVPKPRVARHELPWEKWVLPANPNGVVSRWRPEDTTPLGLKTARTLIQGSSCLATLGWRTQSRWDCSSLSVSQLVTNCYQLKTGGLCASQPVTNCNRLKIPPTPRNLIPLP